jgi:uncharacterized glyoxalase superfamily protein PhnB
MATDPQPTQCLYPFLYVDDVRAYLEFLTVAFGFEQRTFHVDPTDPEHQHGEAALGEALVMIGRAAPKWHTVSPRKLGDLPTGVYAYVDDVDAHCRRARAAGATITDEPADKPWGDRMYTAHDREGHRWYFATRRQTPAG